MYPNAFVDVLIRDASRENLVVRSASSRGKLVKRQLNPRMTRREMNFEEKWWVAGEIVLLLCCGVLMGARRPGDRPPL
jgi:hypothetical protein